MIQKIVTFLLITTFILSSCRDRNNKIIGHWEASFGDSIQNPVQYLEFKKSMNGLQLISDEPSEDWYGISGENLFFGNDSLHFERFWGLEIYDGKLLPGDSVIQGIKQIRNIKAVPFTMRRISSGELEYKIPRIDNNGNRIRKYSYKIPAQLEEDLKCTDLTSTDIDTTKIFDLINKILAREIPNIHSLLILKDNKLVLEEYFYNYSPDRLHRIHSVSKSFTSALTGIAIDREFIPDVNEYVWKYFTDWDKSKWINDKYDIQIQHLLSMSAGLDWKGLTLDESNDDIDMYKTEDYFEYILNKPLKYTPGTMFCYNNGLSLMLGHIIEKSTGMSVDMFSKEYLFNELGIKNYSWDIDENGTIRTDGGLKMRPRDMLKFGLLYLNTGRWKDKELIPTDWVISSTQQKISNGIQNYGFHWWVKNYSVNEKLFRSFYALGHGEQAIIIVPDQKLVVVMTAGNYLEPEHRPFEIMAGYILPSISSGNIPEPDLKTENLTEYTGEYEINENETIKIVLTDSVLHAIDPAGESFRLIPRSPSYFIVENMSRELLFTRDTQGSITSAEIFSDGQRVDIFRKTK